MSSQVWNGQKKKTSQDRISAQSDRNKKLGGSTVQYPTWQPHSRSWIPVVRDRLRLLFGDWGEAMCRG